MGILCIHFYLILNSSLLFALTFKCFLFVVLALKGIFIETFLYWQPRPHLLFCRSLLFNIASRIDRYAWFPHLLFLVYRLVFTDLFFEVSNHLLQFRIITRIMLYLFFCYDLFILLSFIGFFGLWLINTTFRSKLLNFLVSAIRIDIIFLKEKSSLLL